MAETTTIAWCHATFNAWEGCSKVSDGCKNCYAETRANRFGTAKWGPQGTRRIASESYWRQPHKWNREAAKAGERHRVFCASLADVFEGRESMPESAWAPVEAARVRLFHLISETPHLDWLLLTKRPENVRRFAGGDGLPRTWPENMPPNAWIGTSVEDQQNADTRIPHLLEIPARVRFLSCEPLLGEVDLKPWLRCGECQGKTWDRIDYDAIPCPVCGGDFAPGIHWVIVGGESGGGARPFDLAWARTLRDQCQKSGVAFFMKQAGANPHAWKASHEYPTDGSTYPLHLVDRKGGDPEEWPEDIRVRELPTPQP